MSGMSLAEARRIAGSLGFPSKMPGTSYGLPATECQTGTILAKIPGTVCSTCYALGGGANYQMPRAVVGQKRRLAGLHDRLWAEAMIVLLTHAHAQERIKVDLGIVGVRLQAKGGSRYRWNEPGYHRWHDSGDLQGLEHLAAIVEVAERTPQIRHWLPTQELKMIRKSGLHLPPNLVIRVSSIKIDDHRRRSWPLTSSVFTSEPPADAYVCPARNQNHECGSCRACWSANVPHIAYPAH